MEDTFVIEGSCHCGGVRWQLDGTPESATACNCTICRRYGTLWAYGHEGEDIHVAGPTRTYVWGGRNLAFHFCPECGCIAYWRSLSEFDGHRRIAVNLRLAEPEAVSSIPIQQFDGLNRGDDLPRDGRTIGDVWF